MGSVRYNLNNLIIIDEDSKNYLLQSNPIWKESDFKVVTDKHYMMINACLVGVRLVGTRTNPETGHEEVVTSPVLKVEGNTYYTLNSTYTVESWNTPPLQATIDLINTPPKNPVDLER